MMRRCRALLIQRWHLLRIDSDDEARAWITAWARRWKDETDANWAIVNRRDEPVGQVGLRTLQRDWTAYLEARK